LAVLVIQTAARRRAEQKTSWRYCPQKLKSHSETPIFEKESRSSSGLPGCRFAELPGRLREMRALPSPGMYRNLYLQEERGSSPLLQDESRDQSHATNSKKRLVSPARRRR